MPMKKIKIDAFVVDVSELELDGENPNDGTPRGEYMLGESLQRFGAVRGIVTDANGKIPAGNKTTAKFAELGIGDGRVVLVPSDGRTLVGTMRTDWDMDDDDPENPARLYRYMDNRVSEVNFSPNAAIFAADLADGVDLSAMYFDDEIRALVAAANGEKPELDLDLDAFDDPLIAENVRYRVIVDNLGRGEADDLAREIGGRVEQYREKPE